MIVVSLPPFLFSKWQSRAVLLTISETVKVLVLDAEI